MNILERIAALLNPAPAAFGAGKAIGNLLQPAKPRPPVQGAESLTENLQPASGSVPMQPTAANPMNLPSNASISVRQPEVTAPSLSVPSAGLQGQPLSIAQMLQPASFTKRLQPTPFAAEIQPTMKGRRIQTTVAPEFLQKAVQIDQSGD